MYKYLALILVAVISFTATITMGIESNGFRLVPATNHHLVSGKSQNVTDNTADQNLDGSNTAAQKLGSSQEQNPLTIKILSPVTLRFITKKEIAITVSAVSDRFILIKSRLNLLFP